MHFKLNLSTESLLSMHALSRSLPAFHSYSYTHSYLVSDLSNHKKAKASLEQLEGQIVPAGLGIQIILSQVL